MNILHIIRPTLGALAVLLTLPSGAAQKNPYKGNIRITPQELRQEGDSLHVRFLCDAAGVAIPSRRSVEVVPMIIGTDTSIRMPVIAIMGRANYLLSRRKTALTNRKQRAEAEAKAPFAVIKGYKTAGSKQVEYRLAVAFQPWMAEAGLSVDQDLCGCGLDGRRISRSPLLASTQLELQPATTPIQVFPYVSYLAPQPEIKHGELENEAMLDFVVSKIDIKPDYMNNGAVLKEIREMVEQLRDNPHIEIRNISVIGYASPEGTLVGNRKLSENRAKALVNYLTPRFDYPQELYKVVYGGENWSGLRKMVAKSEHPWKEEVISIIDNYPVQIPTPEQVSRKTALFEFEQGDVFRYMLKEYYPHLRKAICKINYDVKPLDARTAEALLASRPQDLNLHEIYLVAQLSGEGSPRFAELLATSVQRFPEDGTANLNAAAAALAAKDVDAAERYLAKARRDCPEYDNAVGVLLILKKEYAAALPHLTKAAAKGLSAAKTNIEELTSKTGVTPEK